MPCAASFIKKSCKVVDYLLKQTNLVETVQKFFLLIVLLVLFYVGYRSYTIYKIRLEVQEPIILHEETTIEDFGSDTPE